MKLGYYIHARYSNYLKYGTSYTTPQTPPSPEALIRQQKAQMLDTFRSQHNARGYITDLERKLNFFYGKNGSSLFQGTDVENAQLQSQLTTLLESYIPQLANYTIDWNNLSVIPKNTTQLHNTSAIQGKSGARLNTLADKLYNLSVAVTQTNIQSPQLINKINQFYIDYAAIIRAIQSEIGNTSGTSVVNFEALTTGNPQKNNFLTTLNELNREIQKVNAQQVLGDVAEYMTKILPQLYEASAKRTTIQLLDDFSELMRVNGNQVVGRERSAKIVDSSKVLGGKSLQRRSVVGYHEAQLWSTQDKVDVVINVGSNRNINASVKNYSMKSSNIHLLSGTSIIKYLQLYPIFGNHYLNITAVNDNDLSKNSGGRFAAQKSMHEQLLKLIAFHALTGGLLGRFADGRIHRTPVADVLILNRRSRDGAGAFRVYAMNDIYDQIDKDVNILSISISGTMNGAATTNNIGLWPNEWTGDSTPRGSYAYGRIYTILSYLHASSIKVSLKASALR